MMVRFIIFAILNIFVMAEKEKEKEKKKNGLRDKLKFSISNDATFEELWYIRLTKSNSFLLITLVIIFLVGGTASLIAFTNLREYIPGYPDVVMRRNLMMNAIRLDSLEREIELRDRYFTNMNSIIAGNGPVESFSMREEIGTPSSFDYQITPEDSAIRASVETDNHFSLSLGKITSEPAPNLANLHFFPPLKGMISSKFDPTVKHYGTDIVAEPKAMVAAVLDGTVIFTGWTMETGYVIEIQHSNNIVSVYKHNAVLLKEAGDVVHAGEPISVVGDSGELLTSGPHLHFELWYKGEPLDPARHIVF